MSQLAPKKAKYSQKYPERGCLRLLYLLSQRFPYCYLDWRQCGNSLALCYFAVVMELPHSLWMNFKSEFACALSRTLIRQRQCYN